MARLAEAGESARGSCWWLPDSWFLLPADGQHARQRGGGCPKSCPRDAYRMKKWAACAAKRRRLPKIMPAGCLLNEEMHGEPYVATNSYILKNATLYSYRKWRFLHKNEILIYYILLRCYRSSAHVLHVCRPRRLLRKTHPKSSLPAHFRQHVHQMR